MCVIYNCDLDNFENKDKCILHCEKDDWYDGENCNRDKINFFWKGIHSLLEKNYFEFHGQLELSSGTMKFENIIFPDFQDDSFDYYEDNGDPYASERLGNFYFIKEIPEQYRTEDFDGSDNVCKDIENLIIYFNNCTFLGKADFLKYSFKKNVVFDNCIFKKEVLLNDKFIRPIVFENECDFNNYTLDLSYKNFNSQLNVINCKNIGAVEGINTNFNIISFLNSTINNAIFTNASFNEKCSFINTKFKNKTDFSHTTFNKISSYRDSKFEGKLDFTDTVFNDNVNFLNLNIKKAEYNRETVRIIKDSFEKQNNIIEANKFYKLEMKEREKELKKDKREGKNILEWLVFRIHGISSNHSQDWLLPILWIIIFGLFNSFYQFIILEDNDNNLMHFSNDLFLEILVFSFSCFYIYILLESKKFNIYLSLISFSVVLYIFYVLVTNDFYLTFFAINTNPFSIMKNGEHLTLIGLLFRVIIAYLIYQLIISIRQNTRRK